MEGAFTLILCIANTKGGVGKTTIALQLAISRARGGHDVFLVDGDRQGSAITAITLRAEAERQPFLACAQYGEDRQLRTQVARQAPRYDDVVIDVGGRDSATLRVALLLADMVLIPVQPRGLDVWALADVCALVTEASSLRDGLEARAVLNLADPSFSADNADAVSALSEYPILTLFPTPLVRRKAFANAAARGLSVDELETVDPKASHELAALVANVFQDGLHMAQRVA
jgi:chromosome partitioning protein